MLLLLPQELLESISVQLNQNDLLSLSRTCSYTNAIAQPLLYGKIVIDSSKKVYSSEQTYLSIRDSGTQISSLFSLNLFFKRVSLHNHIRSVRFCEQIPDIYDYELLEQVRGLLSRCSNLNELYWFKESLRLPTELFKDSTLSVLEGNLDVNSSICLAHTKVLSMGSFNKNYDVLGGLLLDNSLARLTLRNSGAVCVEDTEANKLFPGMSLKLNLSELVLENVSLTSKDAIQLKNCVNLRQLRSLKMINCVERIYDTSNHIKRLKGDKFIWEILGDELDGLRQLQICNFQNEAGTGQLIWDKLVKFIRGTRLEHLHLTMDSEPELAKFLTAIMTSIDSTQLKSLVLGTAPSDTHLQSFVHSVSSFKQLESLQMKIDRNQISNVLSYLRGPVPHRIRHLALDIIENTANSTHTHVKFDTLIHREFLNYYEGIHRRANQEQLLVQQFQNYSNDFKSQMPSMSRFEVFYNKQKYSYRV